MLAKLLCMVLGHKWEKVELLSRRKVDNYLLKDVYYCVRCMDIERIEGKE